jgi:hypothetical protein
MMTGLCKHCGAKLIVPSWQTCNECDRMQYFRKKAKKIIAEEVKLALEKAKLYEHYDVDHERHVVGLDSLVYYRLLDKLSK